MTAAARGILTTGLWSPVAVFAGVSLLAAAPLMRGGNRHVALIALELLALVVLVSLGGDRLAAPQDSKPVRMHPALLALLLSPLLLAVVQLVPLPEMLWTRLPAHAVYPQALAQAGVEAGGWRALSVSPDTTAASLLAALPPAAIFLVACLGTVERLRILMRVVVVVAFAEVLLGLLQISGGIHSPFYFGVQSYGPPVGTFGNRNHFANYLAMALVGHIWLGYEAVHAARRGSRASRGLGSFSSGHVTALYACGALFLVVGIVMSRSRGAALFGIPAAMLAFAAASLRLHGRSRSWRVGAPVALLAVVAAAAIVGLDAVMSRVSSDQLASSAGFRGALARASFDGALAFWPWGSGWGTYDLAAQRFMPASIAGYPNHAHQDYVEMLFEGGIFFVIAAGLFTWLAGQRALLLVRIALRQRSLDDDAMAAALCGLGLLGLLAHSLVEFNLRIPANAIVGALLAGAFLRPLNLRRRRSDDRPAQPHPSSHR